MLRVFTALLVASLTIGPTEGQAGRLQKLTGNGFSLKILEPEGWQFNFRSASQLAHFILHKAGTNWRKAESVIFVRIIPRQSEEKRSDFIESNEDGIRGACPGAMELRDVELGGESSNDFWVRGYDCLGSRYEVVAIKEVPRFFVLLLLSARSDDALKEALPPYQKILASFDWTDRPRPAAKR